MDRYSPPSYIWRRQLQRSTASYEPAEVSALSAARLLVVFEAIVASDPNPAFFLAFATAAP
eukprot:scaffold128357_cov24-Phaeocystis_antarctica.AAC.1